LFHFLVPLFGASNKSNFPRFQPEIQARVTEKFPTDLDQEFSKEVEEAALAYILPEANDYYLKTSESSQNMTIL
jgi:hypothetical protein